MSQTHHVRICSVWGESLRRRIEEGAGVLRQAITTFVIILTTVTCSCPIMSSLQSTAGPPQPPCGDMNGDGIVDVSDRIALLGFLFAGGPAPVCAQVPQGITAGELDSVLGGYFPLQSEIDVIEMLVPGGSVPTDLLIADPDGVSWSRTPHSRTRTTSY